MPTTRMFEHHIFVPACTLFQLPRDLSVYCYHYYSMLLQLLECEGIGLTLSTLVVATMSVDRVVDSWPKKRRYDMIK